MSDDNPTSSPPDADVRLTLRLPPDLHELIRARADRERRSMNSEIVALLRDGAPEADADAA